MTINEKKTTLAVSLADALKSRRTAHKRKRHAVAGLPAVGLGDFISDVFKTAEDTKKSAIENWFGSDPAHQAVPQSLPADQAQQVADSLKSQAGTVKPVVDAAAQVAQPVIDAAAPAVADSVVDELFDRVKENLPTIGAVAAGLAVTGVVVMKAGKRR